MTNRLDAKSVFLASDTWVGLSLCFVGALAAWMAAGFDNLSRAYPLTLSTLLVILGCLLVVNVVRRTAQNVSFVKPAKVAAAAAIIIALWILALTHGLGYLLPTAALQFAFLVLCRWRPLASAAPISVFISVVSYLAFIVGLGVRIPEPLFPWLF